MNSNLSYQILSSTNDYTESLGKTIENITNTYSVGFKKSDFSFAQTLNGEVKKHQTKDFSQGQLRKTGDQFDIALNGPGFFEVDLITTGSNDFVLMVFNLDVYFNALKT